MKPPSSAEVLAPVVALSPFRADVARSLARRGAQLLLDPELPERVAEMAATHLYLIIKELGVDEASPILRAATPEQVQALCDFDCWDGDLFLAQELDAWLAPFAADGAEALAQTFLALDEEVQVLYLQASLRVLDNREQDGTKRKVDDFAWPEDVPQDAPWKRSTDDFFTLIDISHDREVPPFELVAALEGQDLAEAFRLLTAARWELGSALTEQGRHFRDGRMADHGFCDAAQALGLFARPPADLAARAADLAATPPGPASGAASAVAGTPPALPALYAQSLAQSDCALVRALAALRDGAQLDRIERALMVLINTAVVAYGQAPKDIGQLLEVATWVRDTLSLGLLALAAAPADAEPPPPERLAKLLAHVPLLHLFQRGMACVRPLQQRALALSQRSQVAHWLGAVDAGAGHDAEAHTRAFLRALADGRPLWGGQIPLHPSKRRAWATPAELAETEAALAALEARFA